ncbi:hypothetical protein CFOL_v3_22717 [Cephalotus follicularis]|uniref:Uncharacterized protein n=1 Tax=Cephalotus follicularis TaxID=3775 RepID=A0A1Q3CGK7_CEPFO|nr:hypothetical protein CFOL_v3_22717 [Cephalotus follicularis]
MLMPIRWLHGAELTVEQESHFVAAFFQNLFRAMRCMLTLAFNGMSNVVDVILHLCFNQQTDALLYCSLILAGPWYQQTDALLYCSLILEGPWYQQTDALLYCSIILAGPWYQQTNALLYCSLILAGPWSVDPNRDPCPYCGLISKSTRIILAVK